ncbi:MAG: hypothetical protein ACP5E3_01980 [Bacteroidales bacterium]
MLYSHKTKEDKLSQKTEQLEQKLFSIAKEAGLDKWIEYDDEMDRYFPTIEMEEEIHHYIDTYNHRQRNFSR